MFFLIGAALGLVALTLLVGALWVTPDVPVLVRVFFTLILGAVACGLTEAIRDMWPGRR